MKKSFLLFRGTALLRMGFLPLLLTFLLVGISQADMKAQNTTVATGLPQHGPAARTMYNVPNGPFVTPQVAIERLKAAMVQLKNHMALHAEGTGPYEASYRRYRYYVAILENLEAGKGVADSIVAGLEAINNNLVTGVLPEEAVIEKNAGITLLRP